MTMAYMQMAAALVFVILLIFGAAFIMKKKQNRFGLMSVVGYQSFGPKKGIAALKIGKEILILSISPNEIKLLRVLKDSELDMLNTGNFHDKLERLKKIGARSQKSE